MSGNKKMDVLISMKAEIQAQKEGQEKIQKLCFENINIGQFTNETIKLLAKYNDLICLEFNDCKLSSLDNLIGFPNLTKLRLCNNNLDKSSLQHIIQHFPKVTYLDISGNKKISQDVYYYFEQKKDFKDLVELKELQHLVFNEKDTDRAFLFESIPQLSYIDHKDKAGNEVEDEENEDEEDEDDDEDDEEEDLEDDEEEDDEEDAEEAEESEEEQPVQKKKKM